MLLKRLLEIKETIECLKESKIYKMHTDMKSIITKKYLPIYCYEENREVITIITITILLYNK